MASAQQILMSAGFILLPSSLEASAESTSYNASAFASVSLTLRTNGVLNLNYSATGTYPIPENPQTESYTWNVGGSTGLSARMRLLSGIFNVGTTDTWVPVTTDLLWGISSSANSGGGSEDFDYKEVQSVLEIAYTNNLTSILAQCNINFNTTASAIAIG